MNSIIFIGLIGLYRYSVWLIHLLRALIYEKSFYPKIRKQADSIKEHHWKPNRLYFMLVSYLEDPDILSNSIKSIIQESRRLNLPATICMGSASLHDEKIICDAVKHTDIKVIFIRQNAPNKRLQIGGALRALARQGVGKIDPVIFMDGDTVIQPGCLKKCLPIFAIQSNVHALTTNEKAIVSNSGILSSILNLRFAIRNLHMHSLALSKKVLCLTGRFSIFRGSEVTKEEFISRIENDYIEDWYWGKIKFLSGDDKSTWYHLLKNQSDMLYVPDAYIYSIEKDSDYIENLKRWNGNMLRSNGRALALGSEKIGFFPWFVLLDQRVSMWTALISPVVLVLLIFQDLKLAGVFALWLFSVKCLQSLVAFYFGRTFNAFYPFLMYINQVLNAIVKVYMQFHLNVQHWNNQNISVTYNNRFSLVFAKYITALYVVAFLLLVVLLT